LTKRTIALVFAIDAVVLAFLLAVRVDVRIHERHEEERGVNAWGFRGPTRFSKPAGGLRVAMIGGSAAFDPGSFAEYTVAGYLHSTVDAAWRTAYPRPFINVVNLAEPGAGAGSYIQTLRDYEYLEPDAICIYDGYDVVDGDVPAHGRRRSAVFRTVGYLPVLPAMILGRPGWMSDPDGGIAPALQDRAGASPDPTCAGSSAAYCDAMVRTAAFALDRGLAVVVASPPYVSARHRMQQESLRDRLARELGRHAHFQYRWMSRDVDIRDRELSQDGVHLTPKGSQKTAEYLADAILQALGDRARLDGSAR